jgi:hypothetical protein
MAETAQQPRGAHLVGSVPLENNTTVFQTACSILGSHLRRLPDGETGDRLNWIGWQFPVMAAMPVFEVVPVPPDRYTVIPELRLREGVTPDEIIFTNLGYSNAARNSYAEFKRLKEAGTIPAHCRFLVCLPTPLAPVYGFVEPRGQAAVEPAYEKRMKTELDEIVATVPADELAVQWDTAVEFGILEGLFPTGFEDAEKEVVERLLRYGSYVPAQVEMGYHLCYGDYEHKHFKEPEDTSKLVKVANALAAGLDRPLNWIHLPVPRNRTDEAYYAPLTGLKLKPETELYLGLVHYTDGVEGTRQRIAAAQKAVSNFGVATECGLGRRPAETIPDVMRIHAEVAEPIRAS